MRDIVYAVDLGTTTIDTSILDFDNQRELFRGCIKNPQSRYGSDVMNRILTIQRNPAYEKELSRLVKQALLEDLSRWFTQNKLCKLKKVVITGNTTMISILLKKDVLGMAAYPFEPALRESVTESFYKLFFDTDDNPEHVSLPEECIQEDCQVLLSGCISAFLGGDVIAGVKYVEHRFPDVRNYLFLDLGTNGEMVLRHQNRYFGSSTACGPAFEGCTRSQKIYGNTALDAIFLARKLKKVDEHGILTSDLVDSGLDVMGVHLDAEILRQIMLAKAAIVAGYMTLIKNAQISLEDLQQIYIAGGFGFHMNLEHAIFLGFLPSAFRDKVKFLGNTSLLGAKQLIFDTAFAADFMEREFVDSVCVVDFTEEEIFKEMLIEQCKFAPL